MTSNFKSVFDPTGPGKPGSEALHYVVTREFLDKDLVYGFTTLEGRDQFIASQERRVGESGSGLGQAIEGTCTDARFNKVAYGTGIDWLLMYCGQTNPYLSDSWNDVISYAEASGSRASSLNGPGATTRPAFLSQCITIVDKVAASNPSPAPPEAR